MKHKIYLATSWRNQYQEAILALLQNAGHDVYDFKHPTPDNNGFHWSQIDPGWQEWTVEDYRRSLSHRLAEQGFNLDMGALQWADVVVLLLPSGRSAHSEAAYHCGRGGPVIVHSPEPCEPELMYKMFNAITASNDELLSLIGSHKSQLAQLVI